MADLSANIQAFASEARTASGNSADLKNNRFKGCNVVIDMTAITATGAVTFKVQALDALSGNYYEIIESSAISTISLTVLKIYPGLIASANLVVNEGLPMDFRVNASHGNAVSMTYEVNCNMLL